MGAWGVRNFENDDALDWVMALVEAEDIGRVSEALIPLLANAGNYHEAPDCATGLAAAEVVAALNGHPHADMPEEVKEWTGRRLGAVAIALLSNARQAVAAVAADSELKELWEETDDYQAWQEHVADLLRRLA
ncbi:MAG: DUF4259 domain-containing protein [Nitrospira sp.]|nr:DUF4259 domain-containing protein [Nitrospira sp.]